MGNIILKRDFNHHLNLKDGKYIKHTFKSRRDSNYKVQISSPLDASYPSRMSPSKRGTRRIRSREIIEELQIQVEFSVFYFRVYHFSNDFEYTVLSHLVLFS